MRTFSFFNEKGGVGKSFHTIMFASFLAYHHNARVLVVDFEHPNPRLEAERSNELKRLENPDSALSRYLETHGRPVSFYTIHSPLADEEFAYNKEKAEDLRESIWALISSKKFDYILFDFPGLLIKDSPAFDCCAHGQVDMVAVPFDTEPMTRKASYLTCLFMKECHVDVVAFWNNISSAEVARKGFLELGELLFQRIDVPVMKDRIKNFAKARRDSSEILFVRSSVCWPERYIELACPQLISLYENLKERLDNTIVDRNS